MSVKNKVLPLIPNFMLKRRLPKSVVIETTNTCNLNCLFCQTSDETRKRGNMSLGDFKKIVDQLPKTIRNISMNFSGEPLLNRDVFKMVRYAHEKGINTYISTNATMLDRFKPREIFSSGLARMSVCMDGATKKTHEYYRRNSDFTKVKDNIKKLCDAKKELGARNPRITLQTLLMKRNESEIEKIIELSKELGVDELYLRKMSISNFLGREKMRFARENLPSEKYSMYMIENNKLVIKDRPGHCYAVFEPVILWNGDVTICCFDYNGDYSYGNVLRDGFMGVWNKMPRKDIINKKLGLCRRCELSSNIDFKRIRWDNE